MLAARSRVKAGGAFYQGFHTVVAVIDALATLMIRRRNYFWNRGSAAATKAQLARANAEREAEAGLRPWPGGVGGGDDDPTTAR
jgi:hypothetical protein